MLLAVVVAVVVAAAAVAVVPLLFSLLFVPVPNEHQRHGVRSSPATMHSQQRR